MRKFYFIVLFLIMASALAFADKDADREYQIKSTNKAYWTRIALDPESGTVGFTWTSYQNSKPNSEQTHFATLYKNKKNRWKTSKPLLLDSSSSYSSICFNSKTREFFLVWSTKTKGRLLRGKHFDIEGKEASETIFFNSYLKIDSTPSVAYNSRENTYLLVWYASKNIPTFPGDGGILALVLNGHGAPISERMILRRMVYTSSYFWYTYPLSLKYSQKTNRFYLVIRDYSVEDFYKDDTDQFYCLYTLSARGGIYKKTNVNKTSINYEDYSSYLDIANYGKKNANYNVLAWSDGDSIKYSTITKTGNVRSPAVTVKETKGASDPSVAYSPDKNTYLMVFSTNKGLRGIHLNGSRKAVESKPFAISKASKPSQNKAKVLWNPALGKYVVFWVDGSLTARDTIYTKFVD